MRYPGEEEDKDVGDSTNPGLENGIPETPVPHHGRYLLRARDVLGGGAGPGLSHADVVVGSRSPGHWTRFSRHVDSGGTVTTGLGGAHRPRPSPV